MTLHVRQIGVHGTIGKPPEDDAATDVNLSDDEKDDEEVAAALEAAEPEPELKACRAAQAVAPEAAPVVPWGYVVSVTRGGRHRKLHHVGSCWRVPGVDYADFDVYGDVMPELHLLDSKCHNCFGSTALQPAGEEGSDVESLDSSSSSSSGVPAGKRPRTG